MLEVRKINSINYTFKKQVSCIPRHLQNSVSCLSTRGEFFFENSLTVHVWMNSLFCVLWVEKRVTSFF